MPGIRTVETRSSPNRTQSATEPQSGRSQRPARPARRSGVADAQGQTSGTPPGQASGTPLAQRGGSLSLAGIYSPSPSTAAGCVGGGRRGRGRAGRWWSSWSSLPAAARSVVVVVGSGTVVVVVGSGSVPMEPPSPAVPPPEGFFVRRWCRGGRRRLGPGRRRGRLGGLCRAGAACPGPCPCPSRSASPQRSSPSSRGSGAGSWSSWSPAGRSSLSGAGGARLSIFGTASAIAASTFVLRFLLLVGRDLGQVLVQSARAVASALGLSLALTASFSSLMSVVGLVAPASRPGGRPCRRRPAPGAGNGTPPLAAAAADAETRTMPAATEPARQAPDRDDAASALGRSGSVGPANPEGQGFPPESLGFRRRRERRHRRASGPRRPPPAPRVPLPRG